MLRVFILYFFMFFSFCFASTDILKTSKVYIDTDGKETINTIQSKEFKDSKEFLNPYSDKPLLHRGYTYETIWLKFSLSNDTNKPIQKVLVIDNQMLDNLTLYTKEKDEFKEEVKGVLHDSEFDEQILDFYFDINLEAFESKSYYLKISSLSCATYFKLEYMEKKELSSNELNHQLLLALFFGAIFALIIYNGFIFIFTKELAYLYYTLYMFLLTWNNGSYTCMSRYLIDYISINNFEELDAYLAIYYLCFISIFALLFAKKFLNTQKYTKINLSFNIYIFANFIFIFITLFTDYYLIDIVSFITLFSLLYITLCSYYLFLKKEPASKYLIIGWSVAIVGWIMLGLYNFGYWSLIYKYTYFYEFTMIIESILFSIALASRLNKTKELEQQVSRNEILTRELHHRVKNNMQFIISLYRLKLNEKIDEETDTKLKDVENSIKAMSNIHEVLYDRDDIESIHTKEYFFTLVSEIKRTYPSKDIAIKLNCDTTLNVDQAIYCGIILNELVTNAFKYAFEDKGKIDISLKKEGKKYIYTISDNGVGYDSTKVSTGFGLELVKSLVSNELKGSLNIDSINGVIYQISF